MSSPVVKVAPTFISLNQGQNENKKMLCHKAFFCFERFILEIFFYFQYKDQENPFKKKFRFEGDPFHMDQEPRISISS